jgi:hypothetical protein
VDAASGEIGAAELTAKEVEDGAPVGPLLDQLEAALASFPGDGADDREAGDGAVAARHPAAAVIVPPRATAATAPTPRAQHLQPHGRLGWQKASGDHRRALAEAAIARSKRVIGAALRSPTDRGQVTAVAIAVRALNRLLALGRPEPVRIA